MTSLKNPEQRKIYKSVAGQEMPTFQMTCIEPILPNGVGAARGRQVEYGENDAIFTLYDIHNCNCILPFEKFEASFDQERGQFYPLGSRGLFRKVKATANGAMCTNIVCQIETESQDNSQVPGEENCKELVYLTEINIWATYPIVKDSIFWVTYQPDRDKPAGNETRAAAGRWVPIQKPSDREYLEFTCGRVYGNFEYEKTGDTDDNVGINNIFPLWDELRENDKIVEGGNFANMAFGLPTGEEQRGGSPRHFGRTTDTGGDVWKLFKFNKLKSVNFNNNNSGPRNIEQNDVYGIQFKKRGLYVCTVSFDVVHNFNCLGGNPINTLGGSGDAWPAVGMVEGGEITGARSLIELYPSNALSNFHLMSENGLFIRQIQFIRSFSGLSHHLLKSPASSDISKTIASPISKINHTFHFYITESEVGSVLVHQLNMIQKLQETGYYAQDFPDYTHDRSPYIRYTNSFKAKSIMEFVDIELQDIGEVIPVRNGTDVQNDPGPGGVGDSDGGDGPGAGGI